MNDVAQHTCPKCLGGIPNNLERGKYPGALSRIDNTTMICSDCGTQEALDDWQTLETLSRSLEEQASLLASDAVSRSEAL